MRSTKEGRSLVKLFGCEVGRVPRVLSALTYKNRRWFLAVMSLIIMSLLIAWKIRRLYLRGEENGLPLPIRKLAGRMGMAEYHIIKTLEKMGVKRRTPQEWKEVSNAPMVKLTKDNGRYK